MNNNTKNTLPEAVYLYIKKYSAIPENCIFQGGTNFAHLPQKQNTFAVINPLFQSLEGTSRYVYENDTLIVMNTVKSAVQVDIYGNTLQEAAANMEKVHGYFRGALACDFFIPLGYEPLYADDVKEIMLPDVSVKYVPRLTTTLYFASKSMLQEPYEGFDTLSYKIVNVTAGTTLGITSCDTRALTHDLCENRSLAKEPHILCCNETETLKKKD